MDDALMPIAIISIAGRFPGDAANPQKLWDMLAAGESALSEVPLSRFNINSFYHPHAERHGTMNTRHAHFLNDDLAKFDASFFGMSAAEAMSLDPQHRLAMECAYEAIENAGLHIHDIRGTQTSCYVGTLTNDFTHQLCLDLENIPTYYATGSGSAMLSNRISWFFDLKGPSVTIDTACSSSMAGLHLACQSLRSGESTMSIVGGSNTILLPYGMTAMSSMHFLSPDGTSRAFAADANGYGRGEGAAFCLLKPLHRALRDGDAIRAVIRNTGVNQDGNTPGSTVPSSAAQEELIRKVYAEAHLDMAVTGYVEAHGTGTPAGDPLEAAAIGATFGRAKPHGSPIHIGSIKTNIGHLEGASGLASVIKAVLMLEHGQIPPSLYYTDPNPRIPMDEWNLIVPTKLVHVWPVQTLRRVSINSTGYGGTNAHCILDDAFHYLAQHCLVGNHNVNIAHNPILCQYFPNGNGLHDWPPVVNLNGSLNGYHPHSTSVSSTAPKLLVWTAHDQAGIRRTAHTYAEYLASVESNGTNDLLVGTDHLNGNSHVNRGRHLTIENSDRLFAVFAETLAQKRTFWPWKSFAIAASLEEAVAQLAQSPVVPIRSPQRSKPPKLAFLFTGQGAQWAGMGSELYTYPAFRDSLESAGCYYRDAGAEWSVTEVMWGEDAAVQLQSGDNSQPICTALQVALVDLFRAALVGHSSGEIAGAYAAGVLSREQAWAVAYHRGQQTAWTRNIAPTLEGAMLATNLTPKQAEVYIARLPSGSGQAVVAATNSPTSVTLSGAASAVAELEKAITSDGQFARRLRVDVAYHSPHMDLVSERYLRALEDVFPGEQTKDKEHVHRPIKLFSSLTGKYITHEELLRPQYWVDNLLSQVNFAGAVQSMLSHPEAEATESGEEQAPLKHLIEIGPHSVFKSLIKAIADEADTLSTATVADVVYQCVLLRDESASTTALSVAGTLFQHGYPLDIGAINGQDTEKTNRQKKSFLVDLPPIPWNHEATFWAESHLAKALRFREHPRTDILGAETLEKIPGEPRFRNVLRVSESPWIKEHRIQGSLLYPGAGMAAMAIEAMHQLATASSSHQPIEGFEISDMRISNALVVPEDECGVETMLIFRGAAPADRLSAPAGSWQEFNLYSRQDVWCLNASGLICVHHGKDTTASADFADEEEHKNRRYADHYLELRDRCYRTLQPHDFFEQLGSIGVEFGPCFRNLVDIRVADRATVCQMKIPDTCGGMPFQFEYPHVVHPATLDGIVQLGMPYLVSLGRGFDFPPLPTAIRSLYVSADMPTQSGTVLSGYACDDDGGSIVVAADSWWSKPLAVVKGVTLASVSSARHAPDSAAGSQSSLRKLASTPHWKADVSLLAPDQVKRLCRAAIGDVGLVGRQVSVELEKASVIFIKRTIAECSSEEARAFPWHLQRYWEHMRLSHERAQEGHLCYQVPGVSRDWLDMAEAEEEVLLARVAAASADGAILVKHGRHLPQILRGQIPPLQVLMSGSSSLDNYYTNSIDVARHAAQLAFYVDLLAHKNSCMKILEVGAGVGSGTLPLLNTTGGGGHGGTPRFAHYTYTDISSGFFEKAKENLRRGSKDIISQGFEEAAYDLIVAVNVVHATRSIRVSLQNIRKLLKPNGKLVLSETTNPAGKLRYHMIVGSLEGWWYGVEDGRLWAPTLTVDKWHDTLLDAGFTGVELDIPNFDDPLDTSQSLIMTSKPPSSLSMPDSGSSVQSSSRNMSIVLAPKADGEALSFSRMVQETLKASQSRTVETISLNDTVNMDLSDTSCLVLVEASRDSSSFLQTISDKDWENPKRLILASHDVTYVTRGGLVDCRKPHGSMIFGMARCFRSENARLRLTTVDLDFDAPIDVYETAAAVVQLLHAGSTFQRSRAALETAAQAAPEWEHAIRHGVPMVMRVLVDTAMNELIKSYSGNFRHETVPTEFRQESRALVLDIAVPGQLDTLRFDDDEQAAQPLPDTQVEIQVVAVGLNFRDVMLAMGQLTPAPFGLECSGIVRRVGSAVPHVQPGDRVVAWAAGALGNLARAHESLVHPLPADEMSWADAASLPIVYCTAHAAFSARFGALARGESVLIHGAAGGVGQAAIVLAQHLGAGPIFATVSTAAKKRLLVERYGLPSDHIFNSRDVGSFADGVMRLSRGRGVDVVLNSLAGEALRRSWHCVAPYGRFVELGHRDVAANARLDMAPFARNASFRALDLHAIWANDVPRAAAILADVMALVRGGIAKPVSPVTTMPFSKVEEALRLMQAGRHTGKIVLAADDDGDVVPAVPPSVVPRYRFEPCATYVIAGGSGGLGRSIAVWMARSGAKSILLLSRSGAEKQPARDLLSHLENIGVRAAAWPCDVGDAEQLSACLERCASEGWASIRGVVQGAMVLDDAIYETMTRKQFLKATHPKVRGSWNLHTLLPKALDFFILLSSASGMMGLPTQGNYGAGNAFQDALASYRRSLGLAACAIDVGMVLGVGYVAEQGTDGRVYENTKSWVSVGIREHEFLTILEATISSSMVGGGRLPTAPAQVITGLATGGMMRLAHKKLENASGGGGTEAVDYPWWAKCAKFDQIMQADTHEVLPQNEDGRDVTSNFSIRLASASSMKDATDIVVAALSAKAARAMMISVAEVEPTRPLTSYGVDSLVAVELRSWIQLTLQADLPVFDILSNITIASLAKKIVLSSSTVPKAIKA